MHLFPVLSKRRKQRSKQKKETGMRSESETERSEKRGLMLELFVRTLTDNDVPLQLRRPSSSGLNFPFVSRTYCLPCKIRKEQGFCPSSRQRLCDSCLKRSSGSLFSLSRLLLHLAPFPSGSFLHPFAHPARTQKQQKGLSVLSLTACVFP